MLALNFELQGLDPSHAYLKERGFTTETIAYFGLGYCSRGLMQGRIAIPLHDEHGLLVGYAGRLVDDREIDEDNPKYRFPSGASGKASGMNSVSPYCCTITSRSAVGKSI